MLLVSISCKDISKSILTISGDTSSCYIISPFNISPRHFYSIQLSSSSWSKSCFIGTRSSTISTSMFFITDVTILFLCFSTSFFRQHFTYIQKVLSVVWESISASTISRIVYLSFIFCLRSDLERRDTWLSFGVPLRGEN